MSTEKDRFDGANLASSASVVACNNAEAERHLSVVALNRLEQAKLEQEQAVAGSLDYRNGYMVYWGEITDEPVMQAMTALRRWSRLNQGKPLDFELNSPGGEIVAGLAFYDELLRVKKEGNHHLTIRVRGEACSMATVVLQAGDTRVAGPSAFIMAHRASFGAGGEADRVEDAVEQVKMYESCIYGILGGRSGKGAAYWKKALARRKDQWFSASDALSVGLIDKIG